MVFLRAISAVAVSALLVTSVANGQGDSADRYAFEETPVLSLAQADPQTATVEVETQVERHERPATVGMGSEWDIWAPVRMRSADPQDTGTIQLLHTVTYATSSDGTDDDVRLFVMGEWGIAPNHQLSLAMPWLLGDGDAEGNFNTEFGWQWRLWEEKDWAPAFALRNTLFIPTGEGGSGLDWELTGLVTKSLTDRWRVHFNPFLKVASGDSPMPREKKHPGDLRDFQWGFVAGTEYLVTDNLSLMLDYIHETSEYRGHRNQHSMEFGGMWAITKHHGLGFGTRWTLDGDDQEDNFSASLTYSFTFDAPAFARN